MFIIFLFFITYNAIQDEYIIEPRHEISKQCGRCDQQSLRSACAYSLIRAFASRLNILEMFSY